MMNDWLCPEEIYGKTLPATPESQPRHFLNLINAFFHWTKYITAYALFIYFINQNHCIEFFLETDIFINNFINWLLTMILTL